MHSDPELLKPIDLGQTAWFYVEPIGIDLYVQGADGVGRVRLTKKRLERLLRMLAFATAAPKRPRRSKASVPHAAPGAVDDER